MDNARITHSALPETEPTTTDTPLQDPLPLRPLTTLKWPYVPDTSAYPDPLTRDDPKPLQLHQYEALGRYGDNLDCKNADRGALVATSETIRTITRSNPRLRDVLRSINALRGAEREEALQRALGVDSRLLKNDDTGKLLDEDTKVFREFAEAVEVAVRGGKEDVLGLDWD